MAKKLRGFFPPNAPGGSGGVKAGTTIDDDWVVRTIAHIRRRSRSIDSAIGETPAWFSAREEQNTAPSSPTRKDDVCLPSPQYGTAATGAVVMVVVVAP